MKNSDFWRLILCYSVTSALPLAAVWISPCSSLSFCSSNSLNSLACFSCNSRSSFWWATSMASSLALQGALGPHGLSNCIPMDARSILMLSTCSRRERAYRRLERLLHLICIFFNSNVGCILCLTSLCSTSVVFIFVALASFIDGEGSAELDISVPDAATGSLASPGLEWYIWESTTVCDAWLLLDR